MNLRREMGFYEKYIKRLIDIGCSLGAIICFSWLFVIIGIAVKIKLGSPIIFKQPRPGIVDTDTGNEKIFMMYKFRTMTDERDADGNLLPDEIRLTSFGAWLRSTSLDEIPELFNFTSKPLRHCSAKVYKGNTGYFLKSYRTIIAYIPFNSNICYDFLRYVYGYTATSAQHIAKFARDYNADTILSYKDI